jgi:hypothetical protein
MADTFVKIAAVTVGSGGAASIDFSSIPSTYTDLCLLISARDNSISNAVDYWKLRFNNDSGSNYYLIALSGGNTVASSSDSAVTSTNGGGMVADVATANTFNNMNIYVPNYTSSNQKSVSTDAVAETNAAFTSQIALALNSGLWTGTSAINRITFLPGNGTLFNQYSTATLYGISKT